MSLTLVDEVFLVKSHSPEADHLEVRRRRLPCIDLSDISGLTITRGLRCCNQRKKYYNDAGIINLDYAVH